MKKFISVLCLSLLLITSVFAVNAFAVGEMVIVSAHFDASVNKDGTVDVTETWNVEYTGNDDGFCRKIDLYNSGKDNDLTVLESFESISDVSVSINDKPISEAKSGVNTFRCGATENLSSYSVEISSPSALETKKYTVSYTLNGAVKKNGSVAEFAYVFIGKSFDYVSNDVTATIAFPDGTATDSLEFSEDSGALISDDKLEYSVGRVYDTFRVDVKLDKAVFNDGSLKKYSAFSQAISSLFAAAEKIFMAVVVIALAVLVVIFMLFGEKIRRGKLEKQAKARFNAGETNEEYPEKLSPCTAYKMLEPYSRLAPKQTSKKVPYLFAAAIAECVQKGYVVEKNGVVLVGTPKGDVPDYIASVINFLKTFSDKSGNAYVIDASFAERVRAEALTSYDILVNYMATFYNLIPSPDAKFFKKSENAELYKKLYIIKARLREDKQIIGFSQCFDKSLNGVKPCEKDIFTFLVNASSADKAFALGDNEIGNALCSSLKEIYNLFVKSKD